MREYIIIAFISFLYIEALADDLLSAQRTATAAMQLQSQRLKLIAENIANADIPSANPNIEPYRRKVLIAKQIIDPHTGSNIITLEQIVKDKSSFEKRLQPYHPGADSQGYVRYPNISIAMENVDAKEAQRSFEANLSSLEIARSNQMRILETLSR